MVWLVRDKMQPIIQAENEVDKAKQYSCNKRCAFHVDLKINSNDRMCKMVINICLFVLR